MADEKKGMAFGILNAVLNAIIVILIFSSNFYYRQQMNSSNTGGNYSSTKGEKIGVTLWSESPFLGALAMMIVAAGIAIAIFIIVNGAKENSLSKGFKSFVITITVLSFIINLFIFLLIFINTTSDTNGVSGYWTSKSNHLGLSGAGIFYLILSILVNVSACFSCSFFDEGTGSSYNKYKKKYYKPTPTVVTTSPFFEGQEVISKIDIYAANVKTGDHLTFIRKIPHSGFVYCKNKNGEEVKIFSDNLKAAEVVKTNVTADGEKQNEETAVTKVEQQTTTKSEESVESVEKREKIKQLDYLLEQKLISEEEYNSEKDKILND